MALTAVKPPRNRRQTAARRSSLAPRTYANAIAAGCRSTSFVKPSSFASSAAPSAGRLERLRRIGPLRHDEDHARGRRRDAARDRAEELLARRLALAARSDDDEPRAELAGDVEELLPRRAAAYERID